MTSIRFNLAKGAERTEVTAASTSGDPTGSTAVEVVILNTLTQDEAITHLQQVTDRLREYNWPNATTGLADN